MTAFVEVRDRRGERASEAVVTAEAFAEMPSAARADRFGRLRRIAFETADEAERQEALDFNARLVTELVRRHLWVPV